MKGQWLLIGGTVVILAAGAGSIAYYRRQMPPAKPVQQAPVELPAGSEVRLSGSIRALNVIQVASPLGGIAEEFAVKPGDEVVEGQILCRIANESLQQNERDTGLELERVQSRLNTLESEVIAARLEDSRLAAELSRARGEFQRAERVYQRQQLLNREGATPRNVYLKSEQEFKTAQQEAETAQGLANGAQDRIQKGTREVELARKLVAEKEAEHDAAKAQLASTNVLAPADGLVLAIRKNAGDEIEKGFPNLIEIASDLSQLELVIVAPPNVVKRIQAGQEALLLSAEVPGDGLPAKVKAIEGDSIIIEFASPTTLIRPGMTAVARLKLN
jgi:multidrug efflux pump subunit AcrA (membrane-fusion protein)